MPFIIIRKDYKLYLTVSAILFILASLFLMTCEKLEFERVIKIETGTIQTITPTSVTVTGKIIDIGEGITTYGHMAASDYAFTVNVKKSSLSNPDKIGSYTSTIAGLTPNKSYYVRAYAIGSKETEYGKSSGSFTTLPDGPVAGTFTDSRDGQEYNWVKIGNQVWMAENLAYLPAVSPPSSGSSTSPYYYVYGCEGTSQDSAKATGIYTTYGVLYNWPAAMAGAASSYSNPSGVQGVCPSGWHLPSDAEWAEFTDYLGGEGVAGGKLKESGYDHWYSPNTDATNESGFTALPGGFRNSNGMFSSIGGYGFWWSATEGGAPYAWGRVVDYGGAYVGPYDYFRGLGFSVRCVRDN